MPVRNSGNMNVRKNSFVEEWNGMHKEFTIKLSFKLIFVWTKVVERSRRKRLSLIRKQSQLYSQRKAASRVVVFSIIWPINNFHAGWSYFLPFFILCSKVRCLCCYFIYFLGLFILRSLTDELTNSKNTCIIGIQKYM